MVLNNRLFFRISAKGPLFLLFAFLLGWACEKDDICAEQGTPLLVIRFYDIEDSTLLKEVPNLRVIGLGQTAPVDTFTDRSSTDSIAIPLRLDEPGSGFVFIFNSEEEEEVELGNRDTLNFTYTIREVFVSRACGYNAQYENVGLQLIPDDTNWVQEMKLETPNITNSSNAHVKIYH